MTVEHLPRAESSRWPWRSLKTAPVTSTRACSVRFSDARSAPAASPPAEVPRGAEGRARAASRQRVVALHGRLAHGGRRVLHEWGDGLEVLRGLLAHLGQCFQHLLADEGRGVLKEGHELVREGGAPVAHVAHDLNRLQAHVYVVGLHQPADLGGIHLANLPERSHGTDRRHLHARNPVGQEFEDSLGTPGSLLWHLRQSLCGSLPDSCHRVAQALSHRDGPVVVLLHQRELPQRETTGGAYGTSWVPEQLDNDLVITDALAPHEAQRMNKACPNLLGLLRILDNVCNLVCKLPAVLTHSCQRHGGSTCRPPNRRWQLLLCPDSALSCRADVFELAAYVLSNLRRQLARLDKAQRQQGRSLNAPVVPLEDLCNAFDCRGSALTKGLEERHSSLPHGAVLVCQQLRHLAGVRLPPAADLQ
mmetsp:Transcript_30199/g.95251  ORF Transcript_30199/g.95251 Transcript_30199/m.95251 type:complete len:419 (-) Transcript_30199:603-1859(-)